MAKGKNIREKGKIRLSDYFNELSEGDRVCVCREKTVCSSFPKRLQGRSGVISGKRGRYNLVKLSEGRKEKMFIVHPIHLKKI
jgi:ribosomal protein L21E